MYHRLLTRGVIALLVTCVLSLSSLTHAGARQDDTAPRYALTDLGAIKNYPNTRAFALNAKGMVVGQAYDDASMGLYGRAVVYRSGKLRAVIKGEKGSSVAQDVNASGQIVGSAEDRATLWDGDEATDLGDLGSEGGAALAINDAGVVVGFAGSIFAHRPFVWVDGEMTALALPANGTLGSANDVNAGGLVVGIAVMGADDGSGSTPQHAVAWDDGELIDLGTIAGDFSLATGINATGQIVGLSTTAADQLPGGPGTHAARWDGEEIADLGTLADGEVSVAEAINTGGEIVGSSTAEPGDAFGQQTYAVLWRDGKVLNLNELVEGESDAVLATASDINDNGLIIATGYTEDGFEHVFLLTPIDA